MFCSTDKKCGSMCSWLLVLVALGLLLKDLGVWGFWGITGWTAAFIVAAFAMCGKHCCGSSCAAPVDTKPKGKKK